MAVVIQTLSDSTQARKDLSDLKNSVLGIQKSTQGIADKFTKIGTAVAFAAGGTGAILAFTRLSDSFTSLKNSLNSVSENAVQAKSALNAIYDISLRTRTSIGSTAQLFTKLSMASRDLGASQTQIAAVTNAINQGFKISGTSAENANAAITQLSQAFASGKLAGDEFNSVLENAPFLARQITDGLGISLKQLYQLRDAGKLYAKDVFGALLKQTDKINAKFKNLQVTFGDAFQNLRSAFGLLFDAVTTTIFGSNMGGFADMINSWAMGIASFARNFRFYILKAKTAAVLFVVDVTDFFVGMWERITKDGPQALVDMFKELVTFLAGGGGAIGVAAGKMYQSIMQYVESYYAATSAMFFGFTAWLRKSEATTALADTLERMNASLLRTVKTLGAMVARIDFKRIFNGAVDGLKAIWSKITSFDWSKLFSNVGESITKAFSSLKNIDVNKFFPRLSFALDTIKEWAQKVTHWFWWIYDEVIGHSYIPDLIEGILAWTSKLMGGPLGFFKKFALGATAALSSISFGGATSKIGSGLGMIAKAGLVGTAAIGGAYAFRDQLGLTDVFDAYGPKVVNPMWDIVEKFDKSVHDLAGFSLVGKVKELGAWINSNFLFQEQNQFTGNVKTRNLDRTTAPLMDRLHIPRDKQVQLGLIFSGIIGAAIQLGMKSGTTKSVVMALFTTGVGVAFARMFDPTVVSEFFLKGASKAITGIQSIFEVILGKSIAKDPFGFVVLVTKLSLLFKGAREYFLGLAKNIAVAPTKAGQQLANVAAVKGIDAQMALASRNLSNATARIGNQITQAGNTFTTAMRSVEGRLGASGARAAVDAAKASPAALRSAAPDVRMAAQAEQLRTKLTDRQTSITTAGTATADRLKKARDEQAEKNRQAGISAKEGARNFGGSVGGALGAALGFSGGNALVGLMAQRRKTQAVDQLTDNQAIRQNGKTLTREQATQVVEGKLKLEGLDEAGEKLSGAILKGMEVPAYQALAAQFGSIAVGQFIGSAVGAFAAGGAMFIAQKAGQLALVPFMALARIAAERAALAFFFLQYGAFVIATEVKSAAIRLASFVAGGLASATSFLAGVATFPVILGVALVAAVVGAAYLIYKYWDQIKAAGKYVGDLLYKAIMDIQEFNKDAQMFCLNYLMLNKGIDKTFLEMDEEDKEYWMRDHLLKNNFFG